MRHIGRDGSNGLSPVLVLLSGYVLAPRRASSPRASGHSIPEQEKTPTSFASHLLLFVDQHVVRFQLPRNHALQDRLVLAHLDWTLMILPDPPQQTHAELNRVFSRHREESGHTIITITRGHSPRPSSLMLPSWPPHPQTRHTRYVVVSSQDPEQGS